MRKVFLDELPKRGKTNQINWNDSSGYKIKFIYDDIEGLISIIKKINKTSLLVEYNNSLEEINITSLKNANIERLINKNRVSYNISDCGKYWIGECSDGVKFMFSGNENTIEKIKSLKWTKNDRGYMVSTTQRKRLHRYIYELEYGVIEKDKYIDHINKDKLDNRIDNLRKTNPIDNCKNKTTKGKYGLVGLRKNKQYDTYCSCFTINGIQVISKSKRYEDAYIDNLIIQKEYGFNHNGDLFVLLESIPEENKTQTINYIDNKLKLKENEIKKVVNKNKFELSEGKDFYWVRDGKDRKFKISPESLDIVKSGNWVVSSAYGKEYAKGRIVFENKYKNSLLHRYILGLNDTKYMNWVVDHINGDSLDNRIENLIITNQSGNMCNVKGKGYEFRHNVYSVYCYKNIFGYVSFKTELEAINEVNFRKDKMIANRLEFKNKEELDLYLEKSHKCS